MKQPHHFCLWFEWLEAQFQNLQKVLHRCLRLLETKVSQKDKNPSLIDTDVHVILFTHGRALTAFPRDLTLSVLLYFRTFTSAATNE